MPKHTSTARERRTGRSDWLIASASVLAVLSVLELVTRAGLIPARHFPPMTQTVARLGEELVTPEIWTAIASTMQGWAIGLGIATALAIPLGILIGSSALLYRALHAIIEFLRPIPSVALIPLAVLIYGSGLESKVFLVVFACVWPLLVQTLYGVRDVDPVAMDTARSFGLSRVQRLYAVTLPSAVPYVATGLRIASAIALILAVTAELVIGSSGLGREIDLARQGGAPDLMYALIVAIGLLGWILNGIFALGERRVLHWHPSQREAVS